MKVKILNLNLFEGGIFWENIQKFILRENPDILCLQEVFDGDGAQPINFQTIPRLKAIFPNHHLFYSPELYEIWPHGAGDTGNAILTHLPIVEEKTIFIHRQYQRIIRPRDEKDFSHYPKNLQHAVVQIEDKNLHVCNMHGIWGFDGKDNPQRLDMGKKIIKEINGKSPAILLGDFNQGPDTQTIAIIEKQMVNVFKGELTSTFNMRHKTDPGYATAVVDMFFASPDIKFVSKSCPDDDVSDHKPLMVTIDI